MKPAIAGDATAPEERQTLADQITPHQHCPFLFTMVLSARGRFSRIGVLARQHRPCRRGGRPSKRPALSAETLATGGGLFERAFSLVRLVWIDQSCRLG